MIKLIDLKISIDEALLLLWKYKTVFASLIRRNLAKLFLVYICWQLALVLLKNCSAEKTVALAHAIYIAGPVQLINISDFWRLMTFNTSFVASDPLQYITCIVHFTCSMLVFSVAFPSHSLSLQHLTLHLREIESAVVWVEKTAGVRMGVAPRQCESTCACR